MKRLIATLVLLVACSAHIQALAADATDEARAIKLAEELGRSLFDAVARDQPGDEAVIASAKARVSDFCELTYKAVVLPLEGRPAVFFIAQSPQPKAIVFGRHYKVEASAVTPSTKSCFVLPATEQPNAAGAFITHLLSPYPTEFHVFLSLFHHMPIAVGTSKGAWSIENGKIQRLAAR